MIRSTLLTILLAATFARPGSTVVRAAEPIDFAHEIVPILRTHCGGCHTGDKRQGGYSMNSRSQLLAGGETGRAAVAGQSAQSDLIRRLKSNDPALMMPPEGPRVPDDKIALLARWIDTGAVWQDGFVFQGAAYEPPLRPRRVELPPAVNGRDNPIDRILDTALARQAVERPAPVSDGVFLRRVSLDVVGLLPPSDSLDSFQASTDPQKRLLRIDELLADDIGYADHWLTFWNDLLRNDYTGTGFITGGRKQITTWLYRSLVENKPYDQFVRELIAPTAESEGYIQGIRWRGEVNSSQTVEVQFAQSISQSFLGINMKCASCHDSFIDRWKLNEAYGLAAIYATTPLEIHRCDKPVGRKATAAWIFPELGQIQPEAPQPERLKQLAALMTHPENGRFTRTIVNRIWHRLMGRGIVHPVDAMGTQPWNADLLDYLAVHLQENHYDLKATIRLICSSAAYQSQTVVEDEPPAADSYVYRGPIARRMTAEQFMDTVWQMTGSSPLRPDAQVLRMKRTAPPADVPDAAAIEQAVSGAWVWSVADPSGAQAGETRTFRYSFKLSAVPLRAIAALTCDNEYTLYVNGRNLQSEVNWETVELVSLESVLNAGMNEIVIVARNAGSSPNPAALVFGAQLKLPDGTLQTITTGPEWQWTDRKPDGNGRFKKDASPDWKPAVRVTNPGIWAGRINPELVALLTQSSSGSTRMVRAGLVKADGLMRALGRPNRDQIVSMRPTDLTTLEAIELANGGSLAQDLSQGARRMLAQTADPAALVDQIYRLAFSRSPTAAERSVALELLGAKPEPQAVEDLLWAVLMQPEFQLIR